MPAAKSPIAEALDRLVWSRLSSFWSRVYSPDDKEALNAIYEGCAQVLDAELVRLHEINNGKSLSTIVPYTQRRWLRLDMNRYAEMQAFLQFLAAQSLPAGTTGSGNVLTCNTNVPNHARHWHIAFPWVITGVDTTARTTMELSFPIVLSMVEVYRISYDPIAMTRSGRRLLPTVDYVLSPTGSGISVPAAVPGDTYEIIVGFNFNDPSYDGLVPVVTYTPGNQIVANQVPSNPALQAANLPVHVLVVKNAPNSGPEGLLDTNTPTFSSSWQFFPYTGDTSGPQLGTVNGIVVVPNTVNVEPSDGVFVFGLVRGNWDLSHDHIVATTILNPAAVPGASGSRLAGSTSEVSFNTAIEPGVFGSLDGLGQPFEVLVNGSLLPRTEYAFLSEDGFLHLKTPLTWATNEYVVVTIRITSEYESLQSELGDAHVHLDCLLANPTLPMTYGTFDDNGFFDDGGNFDDTISTFVVYLTDPAADLTTLEVVLGGEYLLAGTDYIATFDTVTQRIQLSILATFQNQSVYTTYRRSSQTYVYGLFSDLGITQQTLSGQLTDLQSLFTAFSSSYPAAKAQDLAALVEAANVLAGGGNPMLTLFYDERVEYTDLPLNADSPALSYDDARLIESQNIKLAGIPFMVDHVLNPTVRVQEGVDYDVSNGSIFAVKDLTASRGPTDANPGVWWCPVVLLDEAYLARNFGILVGDVRTDSTTEYKQALQANISLRFSGPVMQSVAWTAAVLTGSPFFTQDDVVTSITDTIVGYTVSIIGGVSGENTNQEVVLPATATPPAVGDPIVRSQSVAVPAIYNQTLTSLLQNKGAMIVLVTGKMSVQEGDTILVDTFDPDFPTTPILFKTSVLTYLYDDGYNPARTTIVFKDTPMWPITTASNLRILHDGGPPYAAVDGQVLSVVPIIEKTLSTSSESFVVESTSYQVGDPVFRGQPLFPENAIIYDDVSRPNWLWQTPDQVKAELNTGTSAIAVDRRSGTIEPPAFPGGYSSVTLTPLTAVLARGTLLTFTDGSTGQVTKFTVIGMDGTATLLSPAVAVAVSGTFVVTPNTTPTAIPDAFFENASPPQNALIQSAIAYPQAVGSKSIQLMSATGFPNAGLCSIRLPNGGAVQVSYNGLAGNSIFNVQWEASNPSLTGPSPGLGLPGPVATQLPSGSVVRLISEYDTQRLNQAFVALCAIRIEENVTTGSSNVTVDESNADLFYPLFKNTSTVLELSDVATPSVLSDLLNDIVPPSSTLVVLNRHRILDVYENGFSDG